MEKKPTRKPFYLWMAYAFIPGQLKRHKKELADGKISVRLIYKCDDGTVFPVFDIGREQGGTVKKLFASMPKPFEPSMWKVYPQTFRGKQGLVLIQPEKPRREDIGPNQLRFEGSFKGIEGDQLTLFMGRRDSTIHFNFVTVTVPPLIALPEMKERDKLAGLAIRDGNQWVLTKLRHTPLKQHEKRQSEKPGKPIPRSDRPSTPDNGNQNRPIQGAD